MMNFNAEAHPVLEKAYTRAMRLGKTPAQKSFAYLAATELARIAGQVGEEDVMGARLWHFITQKG